MVRASPSGGRWSRSSSSTSRRTGAWSCRRRSGRTWAGWSGSPRRSSRAGWSGSGRGARRQAASAADARHGRDAEAGIEDDLARARAADVALEHRDRVRLQEGGGGSDVPIAEVAALGGDGGRAAAEDARAQAARGGAEGDELLDERLERDVAVARRRGRGADLREEEVREAADAVGGVPETHDGAGADDGDERGGVRRDEGPPRGDVGLRFRRGRSGTV